MHVEGTMTAATSVSKGGAEGGGAGSLRPPIPSMAVRLVSKLII